jgi:hypothetical protein
MNIREHYYTLPFPHFFLQQHTPNMINRIKHIPPTTRPITSSVETFDGSVVGILGTVVGVLGVGVLGVEVTSQTPEIQVTQFGKLLRVS